MNPRQSRPVIPREEMPSTPPRGHAVESTDARLARLDEQVRAQRNQLVTLSNRVDALEDADETTAVRMAREEAAQAERVRRADLELQAAQQAQHKRSERLWQLIVGALLLAIGAAGKWLSDHL